MSPAPENNLSNATDVGGHVGTPLANGFNGSKTKNNHPKQLFQLIYTPNYLN